MALLETVRATPPDDLFECIVESFEDIHPHINDLESLCSDFYIVSLSSSRIPEEGEAHEGPYKVHGIRRTAGSTPRYMPVPRNALLKKRQRYIIYVVANSEETYAEASTRYATSPWARVIFVPTTFYLESIMYLSVLPRLHHEWKNADLVGTIAWSAHTKQPLISKADMVCDEAVAQGADIVAFLFRGDPLLDTAETWHPGFKKLWQGILSTFGWYEEVYLSKAIPSFYANYWATTPLLMTRFCAFASDVARRIDSSRDLSDLVWRDASYSARGSDIAKLSSAECMRIWGVPYYTFHPFLFERLPCFWMWLYSTRTTGIR